MGKKAAEPTLTLEALKRRQEKLRQQLINRFYAHNSRQHGTVTLAGEPELEFAEVTNQIRALEPYRSP